MENFKDLSDEEQGFYYEKAVEFLDGKDLLYCNRVWSAWGHGTMSESDFSAAEDDDGLVADLAEFMYNIVRGKVRKDKIKKIIEC